jgi:hypothetical protein
VSAVDSTTNAYAARLAEYSTVSTELALLSDRRLGDLLDEVPPIRSGIGGDNFVLAVGGTRVFVKMIPLTDTELLPENRLSTANLWDLPVYFQYGIGSSGFGVWREVAAHVMTTSWVLSAQHEGFPLMYHWRVLPDSAPSLPEELQDIDGMVERWGGAEAVRERIEAVGAASASVVLFLEHLPWNVDEWLPGQLAEGGDTAESACLMVERDLAEGVLFMNDNGLLHFDAHFGNVLTDGRRLYFADFGLALSSQFELSAAETAFFTDHLTYDRDYTVTFLVNWLVTALYGYERAERDAFVRACAEGRKPEGIPKSAAAIIERHAPLAVVMGGFYEDLQHKSRKTPYPVKEIQRVAAHSAANACPRVPMVCSTWW